MASSSVKRGAKRAALVAAAAAAVAVIQYFWYLGVLIAVHFLYLARRPPTARAMVLVYCLAYLPTLIAVVVGTVLLCRAVRRRR